MVTIKDIAKACGVGVSTVSRVLNNRPDVSAEVREKVLLEVRRSGYIPNNSARDLGRNQGNTIGVVVRGTGNLFFADIFNKMTDEADARGFSIIPRFISSDDDEIQAGAYLEREKRLRGIIFLGGRFDYTPEEMSVIDVPYVLCTYSNEFGTLPDEGYSSVSIDDYRTAAEAVEMLIGLGHRKIAVLIPSISDHSIGELRYQGYRDALAAHGIEMDPQLVVKTGSFDLGDAYKNVKELAARNRTFTAMFAVSDTMALAAMKAIEDCGRKVPEEVSLLAIDGIQITEYSRPSLTAMVQPADEIGRKSVELLTDVLKGKPHRHIRLKTGLRTGGSVGKSPETTAII